MKNKPYIINLTKIEDPRGNLTYLKHPDQLSFEIQRVFWQENARWYNVALKDIDDFILPYVAENSTYVYHVYLVRSKHCDAFQKYLADNGFGILIHYPNTNTLTKISSAFRLQKRWFSNLWRNVGYLLKFTYMSGNE